MLRDANKSQLIETICFVICQDSLGVLCNYELKLIDNIINWITSVLDGVFNRESF